jgi:hypothetical protein
MPTIKPIKIAESNATAIEAALKEVNGKALDHAYTEFWEINRIVHAAEAACRDILNVNGIPGAKWTETSGGRCANSYKYKRRATTVTIERRKSGWFLVAVSATEVWKEGGGPGRLTLTPAQDEAAKAKFATRYSIAA